MMTEEGVLKIFFLRNLYQKMPWTVNKKDKHEIKNGETKVIGRSKSEDNDAEDCTHL